MPPDPDASRDAWSVRWPIRLCETSFPRKPPMSSMKGRVLSRGGWPFLTFVCGIGVVIIEIRGGRRGFGGSAPDFIAALPGSAWRVKRSACGQGFAAPAGWPLDAAGRVWHRG